jgi:hypothetical protein
MGSMTMKKKSIILSITLILLLTTPLISSTIAKQSTIKTANNATIRGVITNDDNEPLFFVRVIAIGEKTTGGRAIGFTFTHLIVGGKGSYEMEIPPGRYSLIRAGKLPLYFGAIAGPIVVEAGQTKTLDLSLTFIGSILPNN